MIKHFVEYILENGIKVNQEVLDKTPPEVLDGCRMYRFYEQQIVFGARGKVMTGGYTNYGQWTYVGEEVTLNDAKRMLDDGVMLDYMLKHNVVRLVDTGDKLIHLKGDDRVRERV